MRRHMIRGRGPLPPSSRYPFVKPRHYKGGESMVVLDASRRGWTPLNVRELILEKAGAA